jgi:threonine dehydrogenase-like Zn-dependent dehydrogenase
MYRLPIRAKLVGASGDGPDVVIEAIGRPDTFRAAVEAGALTGRVVYTGCAKDHVSDETRLLVQKIGYPGDALDEAPAILKVWSEVLMTQRWYISGHPAAFTKIMISFD